ncbi:Helicase, superfamily 1/2, ATP-binding domain-containing protein [Rozella allomycis CSF55]|uniref:Helicase, superfamily 1/2, ATP-binding domain-containing protein n=1 Tax=Rozella allomycis (strain CSF55) TaxID=988480 RepID=A0A075AV93_ROZAC|nr:Helicase, superfamily 1/2, ATP-binding domain-containing protein [Rozella allomycis CSF55]|eukprot:EPZ32474.1 Helicase, superfamily 1/2, ATP-binding domain-containing protein [Rozella allomycis CSF55]
MVTTRSQKGQKRKVPIVSDSDFEERSYKNDHKSESESEFHAESETELELEVEVEKDEEEFRITLVEADEETEVPNDAQEASNEIEENIPVVQPKKRKPKKKKDKDLVEIPDDGNLYPHKDLLIQHPDLKDLWIKLSEKDKLRSVEEAMQPEMLNTRLLPFQREGLSWLLKQEDSEFNCGILADEMGMGKTLQTIALIVSDLKKRPTLIICPTVALLQWKAEFIKHAKPDIVKICIFYGQDRPTSADDLLEYDVILTTYAVVESSYRKQKYGFTRKKQKVFADSPLHKMNFYRVVLDEAHAIKDRTSSTAYAVFALTCDKKICLSGTPLQNRIGDFYSLMRFFKIFPFSYYFCKKCPCTCANWNFSNHKTCDHCGHNVMSHFCWWNKEILKPIQKFGNAGEGGVAYEKLRLLLRQIMLRRTKLEREADLNLPPKMILTRKDLFNEEEEDFYESLFSDTRTKFMAYVQQGTVLNNYAHIFELLTKMRQAINHPYLVLHHQKMIQGTPLSLVCSLCQEPAEDAISSKCKHIFCRQCVSQYISTVSIHPAQQISDTHAGVKCPQCYKTLTIDLDQTAVDPDEFFKSNTQKKEEIKNDHNEQDQNENLNDNQNDLASNDNNWALRAPSNKSGASIIHRIDLSNWRSSTKIEALIEELTKLRRKDCTIKSIVFSQYVHFLDLIHWRLHRAGFQCVKLDGRMSPSQRDAVINGFMTHPDITVFLVSLKAGGVALNLTAASHVFMMDQWWNPATHQQAMDRIHRLGQHRTVHVTNIIIENSLESRILQLQEKKQALFESTVGQDASALDRLTEEDLQFLFVL